MKPKLLIVDDDEEIRTQMKWALTQDYEVMLAEDRVGALEAFRAIARRDIARSWACRRKPNDPDEGLAALSGMLAPTAPRRSSSFPGRAKRRMRSRRSARARTIFSASRSTSRS